MSDAPDAAPKRPWIPHSPEDRFSIIVSCFLNDALMPPFYVTALADDDEGQRTMMQRVRGKERGQEPGQLDYDVVQGVSTSFFEGHFAITPLARKLELKRGKNKLSDNQRTTCRKLAACGAIPIIAWNLREVHVGLAEQGFVFTGNVETLLQRHEAALDALDREAELTLAGAAPKPKRAPRKAGPRYLAGKKLARRMNASGMG